MLDSGATNNFISKKQVEQFDLLYQPNSNIQRVKLADGKQLGVVGQIQLKLDFGSFQTLCTFEVVDADVPAILGMPFFTQVNPRVFWRRRYFTIVKGSRVVSVPLVVYTKSSNYSNSLQRKLQRASVPQRVKFTNSFSDLPVFDTIVEESSCDAVQEASGKVIDEKCTLAVKERVDKVMTNNDTWQSCSAPAPSVVSGVDFTKFGQLLDNFVTSKMTYLCDLECTLVGGVDKCLVAYKEAIQQGLKVKNLYCTRCQFPHFDFDEWVKSHRTHLCLKCDKLFPIEERVVGNPLGKIISQEAVQKLLDSCVVEQQVDLQAGSIFEQHV